MMARNSISPRTRNKNPPQQNGNSSSSKTHEKGNDMNRNPGWDVLIRRWSIRLRSKNPRTLIGLSLIAILFLYNLSILSLQSTHAAKPRPESQSSVPGLYTKVLSSSGNAPKPRSMGCYFDESTGLVKRVRRLDVYDEKYPSKRQIPIKAEQLKAQEDINNSKKYRHKQKDKFETEKCTGLHDWQKTSFPTCNYLHESDLEEVRIGNTRIVGSGYWRDVWMVREHDGSKLALKTMRYEHDYEERNYERHRKDAVAMERLTSSPHVVDIFGFCGNSGIFEFSSGGDISDVIWPAGGGKPTATRLERLHIATQVAIGIADMHNSDHDGRAAIAHTDITTSQFVLIDGFYKLNDFNRARFMRKKKETGEPCGYTVGNNPGKFRAPEEYAYEIQDEKVDIYSMGNIFYVLLVSAWTFEHLKEKEAQEKIMDGVRPFIPLKYRNSEDPADKALIEAAQMCWPGDPEERATASEVRDYLISELKKLDPSLAEKL